MMSDESETGAASDAWDEWASLASSEEKEAVGRLTRGSPSDVFTHPMHAYDTAGRIVNHGLHEGHCVLPDSDTDE